MLTELENALWDILREHPSGLSEFDLLRLLQLSHGEQFDAELFRDDLAMYRAHFLLFHALYRLRDIVFERDRQRLEIHVLNIRLLDGQAASETGLDQADPMRDYYLDLSQMERTQIEDVEALLGSFWTRYFAGEHRTDALETLGLQQPVDRAQIEKRYRRLAMQLHPDRGGDPAAFNEVQQAVAVLRRIY